MVRLTQSASPPPCSSGSELGRPCRPYAEPTTGDRKNRPVPPPPAPAPAVFRTAVKFAANLMSPRQAEAVGRRRASRVALIESEGNSAWSWPRDWRPRTCQALTEKK